MSANHGAEWARYIHCTKWSCAFCGKEAGIFSSEELLIRHLTQSQIENHQPTTDAFELSKIKSKGRIASPVPANHCPLCGPPPWHKLGTASNKDADVLSGNPEDLHQHFVNHLQYFALLSLSWWDEDIGAVIDSPHSGYGSADAIRPNSDIDDDRLKTGSLLYFEDPDTLAELEALHEQLRREAEAAIIDEISEQPAEPIYPNTAEIFELWKEVRLSCSTDTDTDHDPIIDHMMKFLRKDPDNKMMEGLSHSTNTGHDPTIAHIVEDLSEISDDNVSFVGRILNWFRGSTQPVTSAHSIGDTHELLLTVLPVFAALAEMERSRLQATENSDELESFYVNFITGAYNLHTALHQWGQYETLQKLLLHEDTDEVQENLSGVLKELEALFLSWKSEEKAIISKSLSLQRKEGESYPKLSALRRILPEHGILDEGSMTTLISITRIGSKKLSKRNRLLHSLQSASLFLHDLQPGFIRYDSLYTINFAQYPLRHMKGVMRTLFEVLSKNWPCQCFGGSHFPQCPGTHISSKIRLDLTQHQQFDTVPRHDQPHSRSKALFSVLFPTDMTNDHWQNTEIVIYSRE